MKKITINSILLGLLLSGSSLMAKPYIENYPKMLLTEEQKEITVPPIATYSVDNSVKELNDYFQLNNNNIVISTKDLKNKEIEKFDFKGGTLEELIEFFNKNNFYVQKYNDILYLRNNGEVKYPIGIYHTKKEKDELKKILRKRARAVKIQDVDFFGKEFFIVSASPYGHKIAKQILEKDVKEQFAKSKRLKIEFTNGDMQVLVSGVALVKPMTVQRFFKDLGGQNLKNYIVKGNANIPMNKNLVMHNTKELSNYLKMTTGVHLKWKLDGKFVIVEVIRK